MNLHPLFVHFPVALLTVYAILEVSRRWTRSEGWHLARAAFLLIGTAFAFVSLSTGEVAEHAFKNRDLRDVLEMHALAANLTTWIFALLSGCYIVTSRHIQVLVKRGPSFVGNALATVASVGDTILRTPLADMLALLGFLLMGLVGALGGILVYGPEFDPVTSAVYNLLF